MATVRVSTAEDRTPPGFTLNKAYPKTIPAILKIVQAVFSLIAYLCAACAPWWTQRSVSGYRFFEWVCQWHMWSVIVLYLLVLLNVHHRMKCIDWHLTEFIHYVVASVFFLIGSIIAAAFSSNGALTAAAIFGFFCLFLYGAGAYISFKTWRESPKPEPTVVDA
uniref:MARVEL domain-containing protein n=1 Tax=Ciona savignyi TaxID=51511 RepID=H2YBR4_CIOSA